MSKVKTGKDEWIESLEIVHLYVFILHLLLFQINWNCMVSIDYCILTMEIMEIYHLNGHQTTTPKYGSGKGGLIFPNY